MVEHALWEREVAGSSPVFPTSPRANGRVVEDTGLQNPWRNPIAGSNPVSLLVEDMFMKKQLNVEEVVAFIQAQPPETKIYLGADSERYRKNGKWMADYTLAVVVHKSGRHGCKIFGEIQTEMDYDQKKDKPVIRLMTEVYKVAELYLRLADALVDRQVEIHLDINPDEDHASNAVVQQAIGYIKGVCQMTPQIKPEAFAASFAADRLKEVLYVNN